MDPLYVVTIIGLAVAAVILWRARKKEVEASENHYKKVLKDCVDDVKNEISKLLTQYPDLASNIIIEGHNDNNQFDLGNIYAPGGNLTFPLRTPAPPVNTTGGTMVAPPPITLTVSGTVGQYQIVGLSKLTAKKTFKVIYASHLDSSVEGTIYPNQ